MSYKIIGGHLGFRGPPAAADFVGSNGAEIDGLLDQPQQQHARRKASMTDTSSSIRAPKALMDLVGYLSFVSSVVGVIATIYTRTQEFYQNVLDAWPILALLTASVGAASLMTFLATFLVFMPIIHRLTKNPSTRKAILMIVVPSFALMELFFALREVTEDPSSLDDSGAIIFLQVIGAVVLLVGCFAVYRYFKPTGDAIES
jgi:hypothetical protein